MSNSNQISATGLTLSPGMLKVIAFLQAEGTKEVANVLDNLFDTALFNSDYDIGHGDKANLFTTKRLIRLLQEV